MSTFVFKCPRCQAEVEADEDWRGLESPCPQCGETIAIPAKVSLKLAALSPGKEKEQHLEFARLAMQTGVYGEAEEEFDCVLAEDPENIDALYGKMLCLARMSTDSDPKWRSMVFTCTKIERIISDASGDLKAFRLRFIGEFIPIICSAYDREFSAFNELKVKADFREGIQLLAAARGPSWLRNLYAGQEATDGTIHGTTDWFKTG